MLCADLSRMNAVMQIAGEIAALTPRIDVLCNNAGGVVAERRLTQDGFEETFAANHLAPFLLTMRLMPKLAHHARVIATSSDGHTHVPGMNWDDLAFENGWLSGRAYCQAKLGNVLFTRELARRHGDRIIAHALHPGNVDSNFASHCEPGMRAYIESIKPHSITPEQSAKALIWLGTSDAAGQINGRYFEELRQAPPSAAAQDDAAAARLWAVSEAMLAPWLTRAAA
jgi:NAD(P)-dependent dehydrogenase (short-subunit alcohol dehydrogenase family)